MTDEKRCEPPGHLRDSDGEHFVCGRNGLPFVALWHAAPHSGVEPLWHNATRTSTGTPAWAANEWGWRYVAPVTPPATVAALADALEGLKRWHPAKDTISRMGLKPEPAEAAYDAARAALALYRGGGRAMSDHIPDAGKMESDRVVMLRTIAAMLDHPSVYMGGPSQRNMRRAEEILAAVAPLIAAAERERCIAVGQKAWPRAHTYGSENAEIYRAQDHAAATVLAAIRALD